MFYLDVPKPFVEVSIMQRVNAHSYVQQFKYFKILVQEFHIKLDISFVSALVDMFSGSSAARKANLVSFF
jgi:vacuolar protein sorting-associated protein 13A/C